MKPVLLFLTCADEAEAKKIAHVLLGKRLIVCAKRFPVASAYLWKGKIASSDEVLLLMESAQENFREIEREVRRIHSYETFVLVSVAMEEMSKGVAEWFRTGLQGGQVEESVPDLMELEGIFHERAIKGKPIEEVMRLEKQAFAQAMAKKHKKRTR